MIHSQNTKYVSLIGGSVGTTEVTATFSRAGYEYATILWHLDTAAASQPPTTMALSEADGTTYETVATFVGGTGTDNFTIPTPNTSTRDLVVFHVDLRKRKKNLKVGLANTAARVSSVVAILSRANEAPDSATEAGVSTRVIG
jgi:hypothetical protein